MTLNHLVGNTGALGFRHAGTVFFACQFVYDARLNLACHSLLLFALIPSLRSVLLPIWFRNPWGD